MKRNEPQFFILLLLVSFGSVGAVLFTPALPMIQSFFGLSVGEVQLSITSYLVGYALGQLPYGPLANRFGRKKALYMGMSLAFVGSLLCSFAAPLNSFALLVVARFVQALGSCVGLKVSFTMIGDVYNQTEATKKISRIALSFAIMPGIAVALGGWLTEMFNWQSCFYFLSLFALGMILLSTLLPETSKSLDRDALKIRSILHGYGLKFKTERIVISGLLMGCGAAVIYIFAAKAPFIGINLIGLEPAVFGYFNLIPPVGMIIGTLLAMKLAGKVPVLNLLLFGAVGSLLMTFVMLIPFAMGLINAWTLFFPMVLIYVAEAVVYANASSFGLAHAINKSNGSAVINFINIGTTVLAVLVAEFVYPESVILLPISFLVAFGIMLLLWLRLKSISSTN